MEIWKDIPNYESIYQASNLGNIRSLNYKRTGTIKVLKPALDGKGYLRTALTKNGKSKTIKVHRIIAITFLTLNPDKYQVNHINGIKTDNSINNLEWTDNRLNQIHAVMLGLVKQKSGNKHHRTKHLDETVMKIYKEYKDGSNYKKKGS